MFHRINQAVGEHMSAKNWIKVWGLVIVVGMELITTWNYEGHIWQLIVGCILASIGLLLFLGNLERLK